MTISQIGGVEIPLWTSQGAIAANELRFKSLNTAIDSTHTSLTVSDNTFTFIARNEVDIIVTLPAPTELKGRVIIIKKTTDSTKVSVVTPLGRIEGQDTLFVQQSGTSVAIQSDGNDWLLLSPLPVIYRYEPVAIASMTVGDLNTLIPNARIGQRVYFLNCTDQPGAAFIVDLLPGHHWAGSGAAFAVE